MRKLKYKGNKCSSKFGCFFRENNQFVSFPEDFVPELASENDDNHKLVAENPETSGWARRAAAEIRTLPGTGAVFSFLFLFF